jgi:hypothetical protein
MMPREDAGSVRDAEIAREAGTSHFSAGRRKLTGLARTW